jgi:putative transposase
MDARARQSAACDIIGLSARTLHLSEQPHNAQRGRLEAVHSQSTTLTVHEREQIIALANAPEDPALSPRKIVPTLADERRYIASESRFYRVLKAAHQLSHRQKSKPRRTVIKPKALTATGPNQLYSRDITCLPTPVRGLFLYLYLVMDIYSRKVVEWQVNEEQSSALAADLMTDICQRKGVRREQVTLHSDNGSEMSGATLRATLHHLGIIPTFSRPLVSNDNPCSESLFQTLKYRPDYPEGMFADLDGARTWAQWFVDWYNAVPLAQFDSVRYARATSRRSRRGHPGSSRTGLPRRKGTPPATLERQHQKLDTGGRSASKSGNANARYRPRYRPR